MSSIRFLALLLPLVTGCLLTEGHRRNPVPREVLDARLREIGTPSTCEPVDPFVIAAMKRTIQKSREVQQTDHDPRPPMNVLAISGGGMYGAFDVGVLHGWSHSGTRPVFDVVTGVSTGAIIATLAFLGPRHDEFLRESYTHLTPDDVYERRYWLSILNSDSIASSRPLKKKIEDAITPEILKEIAKAHGEGRRLYVGTTNLDTRRFVIWDMGAIATRGTTDDLALFRKIILASASVPGFFPPVMIDVEVDGKPAQEMHVDGGASASVFIPTSMLKCDARNPRLRPGSNIYVLLSGKLYADSDTVKRQFAHITYDAISSMLYSGARGDIFRIFSTALLCGMDFHLMAIPKEFPLNPNSLSFEPDEEKKLYELGWKMGMSKDAWRQTPPGSEVDEQTLPRTGVKFRTRWEAATGNDRQLIEKKDGR